VQALEEVLEISPQGKDRSGSNKGASFRCGISTLSDINSITLTPNLTQMAPKSITLAVRKGVDIFP